MIDEESDSAWAHFEVVSEAGWFRNLLFGKEPWIEVAYADKQSLELNLGVSKKTRSLLPDMPESWKAAGKVVWTVPTADIEPLTDWIDKCLGAVSGRANYQVSGWIEGL